MRKEILAQVATIPVPSNHNARPSASHTLVGAFHRAIAVCIVLFSQVVSRICTRVSFCSNQTGKIPNARKFRCFAMATQSWSAFYPVPAPVTSHDDFPTNLSWPSPVHRFRLLPSFIRSTDLACIPTLKQQFVIRILEG